MRFAILISFFCFFCLHCLAQERRFLVGGSLGLNILGSWDRSEPTSDIQPRLGWSGSAVVMYDVNERFRLSGQLGGVVEKQHVMYAGFVVDGQESSSSTHLKYAWGEVTALFSYMPIRRRVFGLSAGTGFTTRRLVSASGHSEYNHDNGAGTNTWDFDVYDLMHKWSYLLPFQLGASFDLGDSGMVMVTAEYQLGLRNMFNNTSHSNYDALFDYEWGDNKVKAQSLSLKVAYLFGI